MIYMYIYYIYIYYVCVFMVGFIEYQLLDSNFVTFDMYVDSFHSREI